MRQFALVCLFLSQHSFAAISGSAYEARHIQVIEKAIVEKCGLATHALAQLSSQETPVQVDNGIRDIYYATVLQTENGTQIKVQSTYFDSYDHQDKTWGSYIVQDVTCNLQ